MAMAATVPAVRAAAQQLAGDPLRAAAAALGVPGLDTLEVKASGSDYLFGQAYDGQSAWPRFDVPLYSLWIDYRVPALREERTRAQGQNPPLGGGNQPIRDQHQLWWVSGATAWNGDGASASAAGRERDQRPSDLARRTQIWMTPHGFIKGALAAGSAASVRSAERNGRSITSVRYTTVDGVPLDGTLDEAGLVERIETWVGTPVLGDVPLEVIFSRYDPFGPIRFPRRIVQKEAGYPVLALDVAAVTANAPGRIDVPAAVTAGRSAAPPATPQRLAEGVWSIPLGPRDRSVAIELADAVIVVEAPDSEEMSLRALAALRTVVPGKPVTHVINTHIHFDHSGGLRTYAAEGATIVTHPDNIAYYARVWADGPRRLSADRLSRTGRQPRFEGVVGSRTFGDGARRAVVYHYAGNLHHPGMLMVYLPAERLLIEADSFNPPATPGQEPNAVPNLVQFHEAVQRLALDVEQVVPLHGRVTTWDELLTAVDTYGHPRSRPSSDRSTR